jgi:hypothetical protein
MIIAGAFSVSVTAVCGEIGLSFADEFLMQIESNYLCGKLKCITAYYGDLVIPPSDLDT